MSAPEASFLILTEDSAREAPITISTIVRRLLLHIEPRTQTQRLEFRPLDANDAGILALHSNLWKGDKAHLRNAKLALVRAIVGKLREDRGFTIFHYDGDTTWAHRESSENVNKFSEFRILIEQNLRATKSHRDAVPLTDDDVDKAMAKLIALVPFWCIESWLYQDTAAGKQFCERRKCGEHCEQFDSWSSDRGALDEVQEPKTTVCFGSAENNSLVRGVPIEEVCEAGKSLAAAALAFVGCDDLVAALARTTLP